MGHVFVRGNPLAARRNIGQSFGPMKAQKSRVPQVAESARAEREGDFGRARALSSKLAVGGGPGGGAGGVGQTPTLTDAKDRLTRLGTDPMAWQAGMAALVAYILVWIYALQANR